MDSLTDAELVGRTLAGDRAAYGELVTRYQGHVYALAYSLVGDWPSAQDVAQEAFIRAYGNLDRLREPAKFAAWLRRVAFSVAMNWLKAFRPKAFSQLDGKVDLDRLEIPDFRPGPPEVAQKRELASAVMGALDSLPPKYRVPLTMFHLDGLSYRKVADFLDVPLGTAKSLIHRARSKLRAILAAYVEEEIGPMVQEALNEHRLPEEFPRKVLEGLEEAHWGGSHMVNSVAATVALALQRAGEDLTYEFLMGVSGSAFRFQIHQPDWCPSAPHSACGYDCVAPLLAAIPYELEQYPTGEGDEEAREQARQAIRQSIDSGIPALWTQMEHGLIVGYEDEGETILLRPYCSWEPGYKPMEEWPWFVQVLRKKAETPDRRACIVSSLKQAVEMAHLDGATGPEEHMQYACGLRGFELWIEQLRDPARFADPEAASAHMVANGHTYYSLEDARQSAVTYLREVAGEFGEDVAAHLLKAAEFYEGEIAALTQDEMTRIAPMPWMLQEGEVQDQPWRERQAAIIEQVLALERPAVAELEQAVAALP